jgi:acetyl-CoA synthetase
VSKEQEILKGNKENANLTDYGEVYNSFRWEDVEKNFTWSDTGKVNMAYEAIDKYLGTEKENKTALIYCNTIRSEADSPGEWVEEKYTFGELAVESNKFANVLTGLGISKGDRVFVFMPRSPELYIAVLGILKIGAIPGPLFEAFMREAVKDRMLDSQAIAVITTPELLGRVAREDLPDLKHTIIVGEKELGPGEVSYHAEMQNASDQFEMVWLGREDPLILHYTSGSTGKPKGVVHVHNAMIGHYQTGKFVLDLKEDDIYWCTADPGWVTGTSYGIFSPWLNGVTNIIRGGRFKPEDWYETIQRYNVTVWYSAPTAFRLLMGAGDEVVGQFDLSSLRHILSVGEPLNAEVIRWGMKVFDLRIHDNWWMTETGHQLISNYPSMDMRPGSMGKPIPGVEASILDPDGNELGPNMMGSLAIKAGWPGMMRQIWHNPEKYQSYFKYSGWYTSGDTAYKDEDGYFWFQGRDDDVIKTSGERVGPFEVESALVEHPAVAEAGVIGKPDPVRGQIIKAFISLRNGFSPSEELKGEIADFVKNNLAAHAKPREIEFRDKLPKTRSGKIMRRVLKAWDLGLPTGDISTLEE